ncbi:MAG: spermidine synthase [Nannocystaceae bacterium]|nr:fused MFS/spermidine synthase [bacterium]
MSLSRRTVLLGAASTFVAPAAWADDEEQVLERASSAFNEVVITQAGSIRTMYFVQGDRWLIESRIDLTQPQALSLSVFRSMRACLLLQPAPRRVLMVGLGGGQLSNMLFARFPGIEIDAVDIDPEVVRLARTYFALPDDPRYRTHVDDGRLFVERSAEPDTDLLILDAFRGTSVPYHLRTRQFHAACNARLRPGGALVANLHTHTSRYLDDRATFAAVFEHDYGFVDERDAETTLVCTAAPVSPYRMRANARALAPAFGRGMERLASRLVLQRPTGGRVLEDDFVDAAAGARRHNASCAPRCAGE